MGGMSSDSSREMRAMILLSLPCPPMPMLMSREVRDELSYVEVVNVGCNSHDLIAHLLNKAASASATATGLHLRRRAFQHGVGEKLYERFDQWQIENPGVAMPALDISYGFFAEFTRGYIQSYMGEPTKEVDIRFLPAHDVDSGSVLHLKCQDFARAQNILYGTAPLERGVDAMAYGELVQVSAHRILSM